MGGPPQGRPAPGGTPAAGRVVPRSPGGLIPLSSVVPAVCCGEGDTIMYTTILLAAALQDWERYSTHALAARDVAATLAKGAAQPLQVLSVYDYPPVETPDLPPELASRPREELLWRTDTLMVDKLEAYVGPLRAGGGGGSPIMR